MSDYTPVMIDLTKPIRRKESKRQVIVSNVAAYFVSDGGEGLWYSMEDLQRDFENVPEPRKPREIWLHWGFWPDRPGDLIAASPKSWGDFPRFIEWPENAPLPDWPEAGREGP